MKIDEETQGRRLRGRGSRERDEDLGLTSEPDGFSAVPYHWLLKSCQCSSAGFHMALD